MRYLVYTRLSKITFTASKLYSILKVLHISKANGPDNISNRMLREAAEVMAEPLSKLFNKLMGSRHFPSLRKRTNVSPIYKKGW